MNVERTQQQSNLGQPNLSGLSWPGRYLLNALGNLKVGELKVTLANSTTYVLNGKKQGPSATFNIKKPLSLSTRVMTRGAIGFAESYIAGDWDTPDLFHLLYLMLLNREEQKNHWRPSSIMHMTNKLWHKLRPNTPRGSRRNIKQHYDLGNDFYQTWLDATMTYSSALFENEQDSLESAQTHKYARLLEWLDAKSGDHILEIGCGWGGFAEHAARQGIKVTGLTLSQEQLIYARERINKAGLNDLASFRLQDYRHVNDQFDHIVSIEMFEAVGMEHWSAYFNTLQNCLKPGGKISLQTITIDDDHFESYANSADFIQLYIFPGGMLPSSQKFEKQANDSGFKVSQLAFYGQHYAKTVALWNEKLMENTDQIHNLGYDGSFMRMWRYYLAYCYAGFITGRIDLMQVMLERSSEHQA